MNQRVRVTIQPEGKTVSVLEGTSVYEALGEAGIIIKSECGGSGVCGSCKVRIVEGEYVQEGSERYLTRDEIERGTVLACRTRITSDMKVEIPVESRLFEQKILTAGIAAGPDSGVSLSPAIRKTAVEPPSPSLSDQRPDLERVADSAAVSDSASGVELKPVPLEVLQALPETIRQDGWKATVLLKDGGIIGIESGDTTDRLYGVAFDIGTTTVVGYLLDLNTGREVAVASRTNPQTSYGDDVITRIHFSGSKENGLKVLQKLIIGCINEIIEELAGSAGIEPAHIYEITTTGNTTMSHLFLGISPKYLALNPYVGAIKSACEPAARELGVGINPYGRVYVMPNIAGFVGGDTVAVILASELYKSDEVRFAIDIGTNGELVMGNKDRLVACSTAAGPAFEGARITHGMRASDGAIEKIVLSDGEVSVNTIGDSLPIGICGTALIDGIAELRKLGVIDERGKLLKEDGLPEGTPDFVRKRVIDHETYKTSFVLVEKEKTGTGSPILLTQKDVRETQLAKGAILAGYEILKETLGVSDGDVKEVLLAGAFGNYIRREQAKRIGLLPDLPLERIRFIGNAAGSGAKMLLLSQNLRKEATLISNRTEYIELAVSPDFQKRFADAMFFPLSLKNG
ncbi:MAG: DUF4445 domain-containing protein [Spirochaetes bacterium]|nr:DUF4445 domain-containing protein [Spirochaetota bacterium]